jgi:hypothetical protein
LKEKKNPARGYPALAHRGLTTFYTGKTASISKIWYPDKLNCQFMVIAGHSAVRNQARKMNYDQSPEFDNLTTSR